jgi:hypothetical protein
MKHMAVYHLTDKIWFTEIVEEKDLVFSPKKIFMYPVEDPEIPSWRVFHFLPNRSKIYQGSEEPYVVHHFYLEAGADLSTEMVRMSGEIVNKED